MMKESKMSVKVEIVSDAIVRITRSSGETVQLEASLILAAADDVRRMYENPDVLNNRLARKPPAKG